MFSKDFKLRLLRDFYLDVARRKLKYQCPFGKEMGSEGSMNWVSCSELCGAFPELGNTNRGCPCETLGPVGAINQLEYLLRKEGWLYSTGEIGGE